MTALTIREAADRTGHSTHKIRRLIKAIADDPNHKDRSQIEPSVEDVRRFTVDGIQFTWRVSEELVRQELGDIPQPTNSKPVAGVGDSGEVLAILERALAAKEQVEANLFEQLRVKDAQIASLNDRLRESNLLMAGMQKQLPEPKKSAGPIDAEEGSVAAGKRPLRKAASKPRRRRWLKMLVGSR